MNCMNDLIKKIDQIIEDKSLLKHPFYEMWSDGKLEFKSLIGYSKEYYQLAKQIPKFMEPIIAPNFAAISKAVAVLYSITLT